MLIQDNVVLLREDDDFGSTKERGNRFFCVLVPVSRQAEFQQSPLHSALLNQTNRIIYYSEIISLADDE